MVETRGFEPPQTAMTPALPEAPKWFETRFPTRPSLAVSVHPQRPHFRFDASRFYPSRIPFPGAHAETQADVPKEDGAAGKVSNLRPPVLLTDALPLSYLRATQAHEST